MLEEYLNIITNMENYVDGVIVVDEDARIVYMNQFRPDYTPLDEKRSLGKSLFDVYPDLSPKNSTIIAALRHGKVTMGHEQTLTTSYGKTIRILDNTFPIRQEGKIIGAVSVAVFPESQTLKTPLEVYQPGTRPQKHLYQVSDLIGRSSAMQEVRKQVQRISQTSSSVLIYGSTGTGKELVAQSIHTSSSRKAKPFLSQNCAAIPATLLESIFFGTVKGSYTGAEDSRGIFEAANGGTVFLDEINSMDVNLQAKLLRILEEKKVTPVGSTHSIDVDVRIIAATNQDPLACIRDGTLRPDLFYRLGSVTINLPDLKDREGDIDLMTEYFLSVYNATMHKNIIGVSQDVMQMFKSYPWPGNVREFRNVIEGAFNLCESNIITRHDLPSYILSALSAHRRDPAHAPAAPDNWTGLPWLGNLKDTMDAYEQQLIRQAIDTHRNLSAAALALGISRQALHQKLKKYGLHPQI